MPKMNKDVKEKIEQLQLYEQKTQTLLLQKQTFQAQFLEIENALSELETSQGQIYKIVGNIMVATEKNKLKEDLNSKKEIISLRIKNIEKQENKIKEEASQLQNEVMSNLKKDDE